MHSEENLKIKKKKKKVLITYAVASPNIIQTNVTKGICQHTNFESLESIKLLAQFH